MKRILIALLLTSCALAQMPENPTGPAIPAGLPPTGAASGALAGTYPAPTLAYSAVNAQTGTTYALLTTDGRADCSVLVTLTNANPIAVSIAAATGAGFPSGWCTTVLNSGVGTATITPTTSTIEGAATFVLTTGQSARIVSNGTNYRAIRTRNTLVSADIPNNAADTSGKATTAGNADTVTDGVTGASTLTGSGFLPIDAAAGVLGLSRLHCALGVCTLQAAVGSPSTLIVQASAAQGTTDVQRWLTAGGGVMASVSSGGAIAYSTTVALSDGLRLGSGQTLGFSSVSSWAGTRDLTAYRLSPGIFRIGDGSTGYGSVEANNLTAVALATPATPVITQGGTGGAVTYGYKIACLAGDATTTAASVEGTSATGNATLSATDYNIVTFTPSTGRTTCDVFRITGGATQGKIGNTTASVFNDTGLAASGAAPTTNTTGRIVAGNGMSITGSVSASSTISGTSFNGTADVRAGASGAVYWDGRGILYSPAVGILALEGVTSSFPALKRSGNKLEVRLADDSAYAPFTSGTLRVTATASSTLTGTADPTASTTLVGTGTLFLTELVVGDRITVNAETRTVTAIATDLSLTVDAAFTDTAAAAITRLPAIMALRDSTGALLLWQDSTGLLSLLGANRSFTVSNVSTYEARIGMVGNVGFVGSANSTPFQIQTAATARMYFDTAGLVGIGTTDLDGTPATGQLTVKGTTNDGSTNIFVGRDSGEANVISVDTNGVITPGGYKSSDGTAGATGTCSGYPTVKNGLVVSCTGI